MGSVENTCVHSARTRTRCHYAGGWLLPNPRMIFSLWMLVEAFRTGMRGHRAEMEVVLVDVPFVVALVFVS